MTIFEWFKNHFLPNASDITLCTLCFLYEKYSNELLEDGESQLFIKQYMEKIKNCPVGLDEEELKR